jgi:uncharacterized protein
MDRLRISVFPLSGAILLPGMQLPLHLFEPRYRALISDAMIRDRLIGIIQPRENGTNPPLYTVGGLGKIADIEALEDGRYNIVLQGVGRFRVVRELDVTTSFRQVEGEMLREIEGDVLAAVERAAIESEARRFATVLGVEVDWASVEALDDRTLVDVISQISPFDAAAKQMLLEADTLSDRSELVMQMMRFVSSRPDPGENSATLQ